MKKTWIMNKTWIISHLREAKEQLEEIIENLERANYEEDHFRVDIQHSLHHIHTAYNTRNIKNVRAITEVEFYQHRKPPLDLDWDEPSD